MFLLKNLHLKVAKMFFDGISLDLSEYVVLSG